jgi:hypothetical protein
LIASATLKFRTYFSSQKSFWAPQLKFRLQFSSFVPNTVIWCQTPFSVDESCHTKVLNLTSYLKKSLPSSICFSQIVFLV